MKKLKSGQINSREGIGIYEPGYWHLSTQAYRTLHDYSLKIKTDYTAPACDIYFHISKNDIVSDPHQMNALATKLEIIPANLYIWSNSNHVVFYDYDAQEVIQTILNQIELSGK